MMGRIEYIDLGKSNSILPAVQGRTEYMFVI